MGTKLRRQADILADLATVKDRGESPVEMEPLLAGETSRFRGVLTDLAVELAQKAAGFRRCEPCFVWVARLSQWVRLHFLRTPLQVIAQSLFPRRRFEAGDPFVTSGRQN